MGMAGIPWWTTDIGGFGGGNPDDLKFLELLIRWFQWGAFCPVMRLHGDRRPGKEVFRKDGSKALDTGGNNEVWSFGETNTYMVQIYWLPQYYIRVLYQERYISLKVQNGLMHIREIFSKVGKPSC
jgi:alpha-D-xyloside xylohydrolase